MFHSASLKLGLERAVLSANREQVDDSDEKVVKSKNEREAQAREIDELLKKGAYDVFRDDDDQEAEQFMETDIDNLLARSAKKVTYGVGATSSLGSGLGSFSKASFVANTDEGEKDVDLDDPDFWSKAVGLEAPVEMSEEVAAMIDDGVKRSRKQVQVYDPYADTAEAEKMRRERCVTDVIFLPTI
jgi:chromodomain-helicase-DNA-binding protein 6